MVSVVIPLYNKAATVARAVHSVLTQTIQDFELIVVNNGSTDGGDNIVAQIADPRLTLVHQDNLGVSMARNRGIEIASSEWVAFLDADDEWRPTFLETALKLKEKYPQCDVVATAYQRCDFSGKFYDIHLSHCPAEHDFLMENYFEVAAHSDPPFCSISIMARKKALSSFGGFPQGISQGEDLLTWARLAAKYKIAYCREPLSIFHTGVTSSMGIPKRIPEADDPVGKGLERIYSENPQLTGIKQYISHWHKMRASIYLRIKGCDSQCRSEIRISRHWHKNSKLNYYFILSCIPYVLRMKILSKL